MDICTSVTFEHPDRKRGIDGPFVLYDQFVAGRPAYKHINRELYLYYYYTSCVSTWTIGPILGSGTAIAFTSSDAMVPQDIDTNWVLLINGSWELDLQATLQCVT